MTEELRYLDIENLIEDFPDSHDALVACFAWLSLNLVVGLRREDGLIQCDFGGGDGEDWLLEHNRLVMYRETFTRAQIALGIKEIVA